MSDASRRSAIGMGLGLGGMLAFAGRALGQAPKKEAAPTAPATVIGQVDMEAVLTGYEKAKFYRDEFKAAFAGRGDALRKIKDQGDLLVKQMQNLKEDSEDFKRLEDQVAILQAQLNTGQQRLKQDMSVRESDKMATLYREIQSMAGRLASARGLTHVVTVVKTPAGGGDPQAVAAAMAQSFVWADPRADITADVVAYLNRDYRKAVAKPTTPG